MTHDLTPPTTRQELNRKVVEVLATVLHEREVGRLTPADAALQAKTVWNVCAGLVDEDVLEVAQHTADSLVHAGGKCKRHFLCESDVVTIAWNTDHPNFVLRKINTAQPRENRKPHVVEAEITRRHDAIEKVVRSLLAKGYREL